MIFTYDILATKKAKFHKINFSKSFESYLTPRVREEKEKKWREENVQAIENLNRRVKENGLFSDGLRSF